VKHEILVAKLHFYGIRGECEDWVRPYLNNTRKKVEENYLIPLIFVSDWDTLKHRVPEGSIRRTLLFIIHINDLPLIINSMSEPILIPDDTSGIISSSSSEDFCSGLNFVLFRMFKWFAANNLILNLDKMNIMKFITRNSSHSTLHIGYKEKYVEETVNTKFLGLQIDNHINWKNHKQKMIPKLSEVCYAIRSMVHIVTLTLSNQSTMYIFILL